MGYIEQNLMPGEEVILKAKLHWAMFVSPAIAIAMGIIIFTGFSSWVRNDKSMMIYLCFAWVFPALGLISAARALSSYFTTEFALTNKRIIAKTGLLRRRSLEMLLGKVESISINQPIMGRIFNYGTIVVSGTGGTREGFANIVAPIDFRKRVNAQIAESA